jgi:2-polyprenyl-6-methoxyphenol hydroxylase-like FAD-dependent oxidoreductase
MRRDPHRPQGDQMQSAAAAASPASEARTRVSKPRVLVAGAGIGGLSAALFLHHHGIPAEVCEAAPRIRELGVGINLQPHAIRELERIGLGGPLEAAGNPCLAWGLYNRHGQSVWREPRGTAAGHPWPQISIHRGRLQGLLLSAVRQRLGADAVRTGHRLVDFRDGGAQVAARFATHDGADTTEVEADALVGADGIHSTVRQRFYPDDGAPRYGGQRLWRAVTVAAPFLDGSTMVIAGSPDQKFIAYPIGRPGADGTCPVNWIAEVRGARLAGREDWNRAVGVDEVLPRYREWTFPWLDVPGLVAGAETVYEFPMVDRDPLPRWSFGRVTLLGDAAHPMYPIGANGASQAIRDASALAESLAETDTDIAGGLAAYEAERRPVTTEIVHSNRALGPEQVLRIAHERAPYGFARIEDVMTGEELGSIARGYHDLTWAGPPR